MKKQFTKAPSGKKQFTEMWYGDGKKMYDRTLEISDIFVARRKEWPIYELRMFGKTLDMTTRPKEVLSYLRQHKRTKVLQLEGFKKWDVTPYFHKQLKEFN